MLHLDEVNRYPLMPPKVDSATEMGITQENIPSSFSPKVCKSRTLRFQNVPKKEGNAGGRPSKVQRRKPLTTATALEPSSSAGVIEEK